MPKQIRNAATTVAAQNISSTIAQTVKWEGGDGVDEGSPDPSSNDQYHEEPSVRGSQGIKTTSQTPYLNSDPFQ